MTKKPLKPIIKPVYHILFPDKTDQPFDTWNEIWLAWIGLMLTALVVLGIFGVLAG